MRRLIITLSEDLDLWLATEPNQADTVRKALKLYHGDITTEADTVEGLRLGYKRIADRLVAIEEHQSLHDESFARLDKLINVLETRM